MTPDESTDSVRVAAVLSEHTYEWCPKPLRVCSCGFWQRPSAERGEAMQEVHRAHVAALLADVVAQAKAEAWDEGCLYGWDAAVLYHGVDGFTLVRPRSKRARKANPYAARANSGATS